MQNRAFHFEIHDLLTQFATAFNDVVIGRFNKSRTEMSQIEVRYVLSPKERVLMDIINPAQNVTLPVVSICKTSISRDESRVFNKIYGFDETGTDQTTTHIGMPVPVNIGISMSIITSNQLDLEQILSNFIPYSNPYIIISWKIPEDFNLPYIKELRSEVLWDGNISLTYPTNITGSDKYRLEADTTFTIKGWLFPEAPKEHINNIWVIDSNFHSNRTVSSEHFKGYETYFTVKDSSIVTTLSSFEDSVLDVVSVSAAPTITNLYIPDFTGHYIDVDNNIIDHTIIKKPIVLYGKRFQYTTNVFLSSNVSNSFAPLTARDYLFFPSISAYQLPLSSYQFINENIMHVNLPSSLSAGKVDIIVEDVAGWDSAYRQGIQLTYIG